ncbi:hypothetical protein SAMN05519103_08993 [Rhizobiales bacterium GAS113]|nr:hypothetical protein SAMN05519103_08993 [Rhizobiales bacterium GAS113]
MPAPGWAIGVTKPLRARPRILKIRANLNNLKGYCNLAVLQPESCPRIKGPRGIFARLQPCPSGETRTTAACLPMKPVGEPDAGDPHVRFEKDRSRRSRRSRDRREDENGHMGGSEAETIRQPRDRLRGQPQERQHSDAAEGQLSSCARFVVKARSRWAPTRTVELSALPNLPHRCPQGQLVPDARAEMAGSDGA